MGIIQGRKTGQKRYQVPGKLATLPTPFLSMVSILFRPINAVAMHQGIAPFPFSFRQTLSSLPVKAL